MFTEKYNSCIGLTGQFYMCGNAFRLDSYKGCTFGCSYCFANARKLGGYKIKYQSADPNKLHTLMYDSIIKNKKNTLTKELLNRRVPLHLGGMSDPFQEIEWKNGVTKEFIKISNEFNYPINFSTKTSFLPNDYFKLLNPEIHTFSISIMGYSNEYIRLFEKNTPTAKNRIEFVKKLHNNGFWVSIRIQPIIDINEVITLIENSEKYVNYYTVEHLKLPIDNQKIVKDLLVHVNKYRMNLQSFGREYEFHPFIKIKNIELLKSITNVKIGCGDNDLHHYSDSLNCCGIDLMPKSFSNWIKYNTMYIKMTNDRTQYSPKCSCHHCFYTAMQNKNFTHKDYVNHYFNKIYGDETTLKLFDI
jgi:DNA repair photolyase